MRAPPNLGRSYETAFNKVFAELAKKHDVVFYPFFLSGVAARPALNLADGIHPNRDGVAVIVDRIAPYVVRLLGNPMQE
jgi:acyl-CoA thioesterase-1